MEPHYTLKLKALKAKPNTLKSGATKVKEIGTSLVPSDIFEGRWTGRAAAASVTRRALGIGSFFAGFGLLVARRFRHVAIYSEAVFV